MGHPFAPGEPIGPYDGYSRYPRTQDFVTGYNIATRPRTHERVSFDVLRGLIDNYDVADLHLAQDRHLAAWNGSSSRPTGTTATWPTRSTSAWRRSGSRTGINGFDSWFAKWAWDVLAYDAAPFTGCGTGAASVGLLPFDGTTIAPLLDYWGTPANPGAPKPEAYVQFANGLPWNWLTRADLIYAPFRPRTAPPTARRRSSRSSSTRTPTSGSSSFPPALHRRQHPRRVRLRARGLDTGPDRSVAGTMGRLMYGDQARKSQVKWMPGGTSSPGPTRRTS